MLEYYDITDILLQDIVQSGLNPYKYITLKCITNIYADYKVDIVSKCLQYCDDPQYKQMMSYWQLVLHKDDTLLLKQIERNCGFCFDDWPATFNYYHLEQIADTIHPY